MNHPTFRCPGLLRLLALASLGFMAACGSGSQDSTGNGGTGGATGGNSAGAGTGGGGNAGTTGSAGTSAAGTAGSSGAAGTTGAAGATGAAGTTGTGGTTGAAGTTGAGGATGAAGRGGTTGSAGTTGGGGTTGAAGRGGTTGAAGTTGAGGSDGAFSITSPLWVGNPACAANMSSSCATLPKDITRSGAGTSPELHWANPPAGTKSFAVVLQDLSGNSTHWVIWNIPSTATGLPANVDKTSAMPANVAGSQQAGKGTDAATKNGYIGPGAACNVYEFMVYALNVATFSPTSAADPAMVRTQLNALNATTLLGTASLRGRTNMTCSN